MSTATARDMELAHAALFGEGTWEQRIGQLIADQREADALICDQVANNPHRTVSERGLARMLAEQIREGRA